MFASVAQQVERRTRNAEVVCSIHIGSSSRNSDPA